MSETESVRNSFLRNDRVSETESVRKSVMLLSLTRTWTKSKGCETLGIRNGTDVYLYFCLATGNGLVTMRSMI